MAFISIRRSIAAVITTAVLAVLPSGPVSATDGDTVDGRFSRSGVIVAGTTMAVDIAGRGGVATDASAVSLNVTITQPVGHGYATVFPCGGTRPNASSINFTPGATIANAIVSELGADGRVCIHASSTTHVLVDVDGYFTGTGYRGLGPARLLDTRPGQPTVDGRDSGIGRRSAGAIYALDVAGRAGVAPDAASVALTLTVTAPTSQGHVTVFPCDEPQPATSTVNHGAGQTIANSFVGKVDGNGRVCVFTHSAAHLVVDVNGQFERRTFLPLRPARLLDTRLGHDTVDGRAAGIGRRAAGSTLALDVTGRGGVANDADAVALNVTVTGARGNGHLTVFPCGSSRPAASTINFGPGDTIANAVVAKVGSRGEVCIFTHAETHVVVDVAGHVPGSGSGFHPLVPARLVDTRPAEPPSPSELAALASLTWLNELRAAHGAPPVQLDASMSAQALGWSQEMARSGFRHSGMSGYAENIAWHSRASLSPADAAERLHRSWVDSPGHFATMIDPQYTKVGIGLDVSGSGWYGTHLFAR